MQICNRVGRLLNFIVVGQKIACAKFADSNVEAILQRLKTEFMIRMLFLFTFFLFFFIFNNIK